MPATAALQRPCGPFLAWCGGGTQGEVRRRRCHALVDLTGHAGTSLVAEVRWRWRAAGTLLDSSPTLPPGRAASFFVLPLAAVAIGALCVHLLPV